MTFLCEQSCLVAAPPGRCYGPRYDSGTIAGVDLALLPRFMSTSGEQQDTCRMTNSRLYTLAAASWEEGKGPTKYFWYSYNCHLAERGEDILFSC